MCNLYVSSLTALRSANSRKSVSTKKHNPNDYAIRLLGDIIIFARTLRSRKVEDFSFILKAK